jgi:hypothetical protein
MLLDPQNLPVSKIILVSLCVFILSLGCLQKTKNKQTKTKIKEKKKEKRNRSWIYISI